MKYCPYCQSRIPNDYAFCPFCGKRQTDEYDEETTGYVCNVCGRFNPTEYLFCPKCGTERFADSVIEENAHSIFCNEQWPTEPQNTREYLDRLGLLEQANKTFTIHVCLVNGGIIDISLSGSQSSQDALEVLQTLGYISDSQNVRFKDWPRANPVYGRMHHHASACVCELEKGITLHLEEYSIEDMVCLYGCPNPKSFDYDDRLTHCKVEVVDYEQ